MKKKGLISFYIMNNCSHPRGVDQMYHDGSHVHLSEEDQIAAEQSFSIYCKPVELYNILQRRAVDRVTIHYTYVYLHSFLLLVFFKLR